jgi:hypothetical protein
VLFQEEPNNDVQNFLGIIKINLTLRSQIKVIGNNSKEAKIKNTDR